MSDMTLSEAANLTKQFSRFLKGMARLEEAAAALEGADQTVAERKAEAERLAKQIDEARAALESIQSDGRAALVRAQADAQSVRDAAAADAEVRVKEARELVAQANKDRDEARAAQRVAEHEVARLRGDVKIAEQELASLTDRIAAARAQAKSLIEGA